jgi:hypothetical protein
MFHAMDIFLIPFSLLWGGIPTFVGISALLSGTATPAFFAILPFFIIGLYLIAGRFAWDAYVRANTRYALTDDSAFILRSGFGGGISNVYLPRTNNLNVKIRPDGSGTIYFGNAPSMQQELGAMFGQLYGKNVPTFISIPNAAAVYEMCITATKR